MRSAIPSCLVAISLFACGDDGGGGEPRLAVWKVALSRSRTCAIREGELWCWGAGVLGPLDSVTTEPTLVDLPGPVRDVAVSPSHICAAVHEQGVYCWGAAGAGQLGIPADPEDPAQYVTGPVTSGFPGTVVRIVAGERFTCALDGKTSLVQCSGANLGDGLGLPTHEASIVPAVRDATELAASEGHACAVEGPGDVVCWGNNASGELGREPGDDGDVARTVEGVTGAVTLVAASGTTCALGSAGTSCWGAGQGLDPAPSPGASPQSVALPYEELSFGQAGGCGRSGTTLSCWGARFVDGEGTTETAAPFALPLEGVETFAASGTHACAWTDEALFCWGLNDQGQIGALAGTTAVVAPTEIMKR